jgi:hypothetical protein
LHSLLLKLSSGAQSRLGSGSQPGTPLPPFLTATSEGDRTSLNPYDSHQQHFQEGMKEDQYPIGITQFGCRICKARSKGAMRPLFKISIDRKMMVAISQHGPY